MQIPPTLRAALESEAGRFRLAELAAAHARLSESYRNGIPLQRLSDAERVAYALARMPATYAAGRAVLEEVIRVAGSGDSAPAITTPAVPPPPRCRHDDA